ncbi:MAG TPA: Ig-like domain-containing protein, partial [Ilumatobacteraceae bacterium]
GHGTTDVVSGTSVAYTPDPGFSGIDSFEYTITDPSGERDTALVNLELFPPGSPNQPPIARADKAKTRPGRPVTIDVLANDIDPERDQLAVATFAQKAGDTAKIADATGPSGLPALRYTPPDAPGFYEFTYQAADPQGGLSQKTTVNVEVSGTNAPNEPPNARPDSIRLPVGVQGSVNVLANDDDPDGEELTLSTELVPALGVDAQVRGQQIDITIGPGANELSVIGYTISAGPGNLAHGQVLVVRIGDTAKNRPPIANADTERVVVGNSVKIPVTANDVDPDRDPITLLTVAAPANGAGTTSVEGNSVRFTPTLEDLTEPTPVTFSYTIGDGQNHQAKGNVTVTVLLEALPRAPNARDDFGDTVVDKPVTIDVLANDSDPSGGRPSLAGDPVCAGGGIAKITPDERVVFTPPSGGIDTYRCKYTVVNQQGLSTTASIIVTVAPAPAGNQAPVVNQIAKNQQVNLGATLTLTARDLASDPDGDPLVFTSVDNASSGGTVINPGAGSFTYTAPPAGSADNVPQSVNVKFTISDGRDGGNVTDTVSIKLVNPNTTPPGVPPTPQTRDIPKVAFAGDTVQVDVVGFLRDANPGTTLTLKDATYASGPGSVQSFAGGIVTMLTTGAGELVVNYTVTNTEGGSAIGKIRVTLTDRIPANPPVAVNDQMTVASGGSGSLNVLDNDLGISDPGDVVQIGLSNRPPANFGTVQLSSTGLMTFQATTDASGVIELTYTLTDGTGVTSSAKVTITLLACGESAPDVRDNISLFTPYQTPIAIDLNQYVLAGSFRPGSSTGAGLNGAASGVYTPPAGMNGTETVTYVVENGCHQAITGHVAIDVNRSPVAGTITRELPRGAPPLVLSVTDLATDDEPLAIASLANNPAWVTLVPGSSGSPGSFDNATIQADPPAGTPAATYTMNATVQDPGGLTAVATIKLIIRNLAPTAVADAYNTDQANFSFDPTGNDIDPEGGQLCVQTVAVTGGAGADIISPNPNNPPPGCNSSVHVRLEHGQTTFSYSISDDGGLTDTSTITITYNNAPTVADASGTTAGQPSVDVEMTVTEPDGDPVTLTCNSGPGANPAFSTTVRPQPGSGPDPVGHPRFTVTVTVVQPFSPPGIIPCFATDNLGAVSNTATITIRVIDPG